MTAKAFKEQSEKIGKYRWTICTLVFFATTVNYLDRQVIGILKPLLETDLGIGEAEYGFTDHGIRGCASAGCSG